ncbi:DUF2332 domain-containing protein [Pacificoceanicola onchidii]|uniref:DUF2332 domain-containing protein n=1 Tax=Pacificoceanicola onchidii TaxID=2562685 RepID=UPI0010A54363|nr:DUF2332 family protein [Pacificoceanicola onchidii]
MGETIKDAFLQQAQSCAALGSPFMDRLMTLCADRLGPETAVGARCHAWQGVLGPSGQSVPLRLAGALHGLVLSGEAPELAAVYPPNAASDAAIWQAVSEALVRHEATLQAWLENPPQTNEVRRAAAVIAGLWWGLGQVGPRPVVLSELGGSAGLNLQLDRFSVAMDGAVYGPAEAEVALTPEWRGAGRPVPLPIRVQDRGGVDLMPLDPTSPEGAHRLLSYLWPDQPVRLARTRAAIALCETRLDAGDAAGWLEQRLRGRVPGALHMVYSTIAAQYFPPETQAAVAGSLAEAGARATADAPLLHFAMEPDEKTPGAGLTATLWAGSAPITAALGRAHFHVDWIEWQV